MSNVPYTTYTFTADNQNSLILSNSVATVLGLLVIIRVKVNVMNDDNIGRSQVDSKATCKTIN